MSFLIEGDISFISISFIGGWFCYEMDRGSEYVNLDGTGVANTLFGSGGLFIFILIRCLLENFVYLNYLGR